MFYAHFVLSKKGPLARIWLAAHWDKKLTKAHVFETNIDSSVEAIMQPKVKLALRTSGHLLLGVVRIYSRKAKYLLADCNEAFVKIKMAFRPGVVDLPEENREAAVAAITLQENFHDFDTTLADLNDIDMQAQFSVNQSRPEEITMREDLTNITFVGDDGFGDVGFDDREILRDATNLEDSLYKQPDLSSHQPVADDKDKTLMENATDKPMDVDLEAPVTTDDFGGAVDGPFMGGDFMEPGAGLFEDAPVADVSMAPAVEAEGPTEKSKPDSPTPPDESHEEAEAESIVAPPLAAAATSGEQTTLITNEEEAFALGPLEATVVSGTERRTKRKRKLVVDETICIPSETMKLQLSDTSDITTTLDLAPPTKKLMHWKETGGVEKLFALPSRPIVSKCISKLFSKNLSTRPVTDVYDKDEELLELESPEVSREMSRHEKHQEKSMTIQEISTIVEEPSTLDITTRSRKSETIAPTPKVTPSEPEPIQVVEQPSNAQDLFANTFSEAVVDLPPEPTLTNQQIDYEDGPPSIAPFSVPPPSVAPPSVAPPTATAPTFHEDVEGEAENMPENEEQEEKRWTKRTQLMQHSLEIAFRYNDSLSFKDMARRLNRKQAASRFYTLLVLKKHQAIEVQQSETFGDIHISRGPQFGLVC